MLKEMSKNPGKLRNSSRYHDVTAKADLPTLAEIGISKKRFLSLAKAIAKAALPAGSSFSD